MKQLKPAPEVTKAEREDIMYKLIYWLPNQSKIFSAPQYYETNDRNDFIHALEVVEQNGYEIEFATEL